MYNAIPHGNRDSGLPPLRIRGRETLPIIQGGMGVNISNGKLAGGVAYEGGIGTLSSVGLAWVEMYKREIFHKLIREAKGEPEILENIRVEWAYEKFREAVFAQCQEAKIAPPKEEKIQASYNTYKLFHEATLQAALMEIIEARRIAGDNGALWLNVMKAIHEYKMHVDLACKSGLHGIVSGAGLPMDLPELVKNTGNKDIALIPILSNLRGVQLVMRKWERNSVIPDAIVLEDPTRAAGHLGASTVKNLTDESANESRLEVAVPAVVEFLRGKGLVETVPVIAAGDIVDRNDIAKALELGAKGVQMGTRFLATEESGANTDFKLGVVGANTDSDILTYNSNAMLPARGLERSGVFGRIAGVQAKVRPCVENCLVECAFRDGKGTNKLGEVFAQMCILEELALSTQEKGGSRGLMFCGVSALRVNDILSVRQVMQNLIRG